MAEILKIEEVSLSAEEIFTTKMNSIVQHTTEAVRVLHREDSDHSGLEIYLDDERSESESENTNTSLKRDGRVTVYNDIENCLGTISQGTMTKTAASIFYKIPLSKIYREIKKRNSVKRKSGKVRGHKPLFDRVQEKVIFDWIIQSQLRGTPRDLTDVLEFANNHASNLKLPLMAEKISRNWLSGFFRRNPMLSELKPQAISYHASQIKLETVQQWLRDVKLFMIGDEKLRNIIDKPEHWANTDESNVELNIKSKYYVGVKGLPMNVADDSSAKNNFTVTYTVMATGEILTTQILLKNSVTDAEIIKINRQIEGLYYGCYEKYFDF